MSQIFRALKKVSKNQTNPQPNPMLDESEEACASKKESHASLENAPKVKVPTETTDGLAAKEAEEDVSIGQSVEDLRKFCEQMDDYVEISKKFLNRAYASDEQKILERRLKSSVAELMSIQNEIKTIMDNIKNLKIQIAAVRNNIEDHKNKFNVLKTEERRTRFFLTHESNKREKNARNLEKSTHRENESRIPKYFISPSSGPNTRSIGGNTQHTTFVSVGSGSENESSRNSRSHSVNTANAASRSVRPTNRPLASTVKRVKALRAKKEAPSVPAPQNEPNGVTVVLQPISEPEKQDLPNTEHSQHSSPTASIVNFPWFNGSQPEQNLSETRTNSAVSASNSLFVFNSSGHFDDLD